MWLPIPASYRALTARLMPPTLRDAFELPTANRSGAPLVASSLGSNAFTRFCRHGCATLVPIMKQLLGWLASHNPII
jgi:hypothetical protein